MGTQLGKPLGTGCGHFRVVEQTKIGKQKYANKSSTPGRGLYIHTKVRTCCECGHVQV